MKKKKGPKAGHKKGQKKAKLSVNHLPQTPASVNTEENPGSDSNEGNSVSKIGIDSPFTVTDDIHNISSVVVDRPSYMLPAKSGHGRVKVKLKSSRPSEAHAAHSDAQTKSDTDTSNSKVILPGQKLSVENMEDGAYSDGLASDLQTTTSGKSHKKSGSIKIISSMGLDSSSMMNRKYLNNLSNAVHMLGERGQILSDNERTVDQPASHRARQRDTISPRRNSCYDEKELNASLVVIKKVMKMDAAEPFNAPVDPVALGIPDYFDVIETPMDFGTICNNLEHGLKYLNSEDVFKDVQIIWENCIKYNNKGDYILDLMKRVKKNFTKYWMAAGLYSDVHAIGVNETSQSEDMRQFHQEKTYLKGKIPKPKRKRHGINHHKHDCLCAVCVVRRQKKEREETTIVENVMGTSAADMSYEQNHEEVSPIENPDSEQSSSSISQSPEHADVEEPEGETNTPDQEIRQLDRQDLEDNEMDIHNIRGIHVSPLLAPSEREMQDDSSQPSQGQEHDMDFAMQRTDYQGNLQEEGAVTAEKHSEVEEESSELHNQVRLYEDPSRQENHSILQICRTIFSKDHRSIWTGPHSLSRGAPVSSVQEGPIHAAMSLFLKQH